MLEYFQIILFLPTPESQDSPMFCAKMGVLGLPQGISNRSYSNMLFPPTPASPDSPILFAKLVVLRPSQRYFKQKIFKFISCPPLTAQILQVVLAKLAVLRLSQRCFEQKIFKYIIFASPLAAQIFSNFTCKTGCFEAFPKAFQIRR